MTTYAKLTPEGQLNVLRYIPHVACPSEERMAAYAAANAYKPVLQTPAPGKILHAVLGRDRHRDS